jgi:hypothetical protein
MKKLPILKKFDGHIYKRGEIVIIDGIPHTYSKMVKGKQIFKLINNNSK